MSTQNNNELKRDPIDIIAEKLGLDIIDARLVVDCLKDKDVSKLPPEFFNKDNWVIIPSNMNAVNDVLYEWRYKWYFEEGGELDQTWQEEFDYFLSDYSKKLDSFLLPLTYRCYQLCSFIFIKNPLHNYFNL